MKFIGVLIVFCSQIYLSVHGQSSCEGLYFDGKDDRVTIPFISEYALGANDYTIEAWINSEPVEGTMPTILSNRTEVDKDTGMTFGITKKLEDGSIEANPTLFHGKNDREYGLISELITGLQDGSFQHILLTKENFENGSTGLAFYKNGVLLDRREISTGIGITLDTWLTIGLDASNQDSTAFKGYITHVQLWNRAKSQLEVLEEYDQAPDLTDPSLIGYWKLNEGEGQVVKDYSKYANHGVLGQINTKEDSDPTWSEIPENYCLAPQLVERETSFCVNEKVTFLAEGDVSYQWWFASNPDLVISQENKVTINTQKTDVLFVEGSKGFLDSVNITVSSEGECRKNLTFYNFITPNGDGQNDFFEIDNLEKYASNELWIYDRWGREIFYTKGYTGNWGSDIKKGVYYYLLLVDGNKEEGSILVK